MKKILFVCLGNICRSPAAEAIFNNILERAGLNEEFSCDSSGTYRKIAGTSADERMVSAAQKRKIFINHKSRHTLQTDFDKYDYIVGMDDNNIRKLEKIRGNINIGKAKILKMSQFLENGEPEIPDPYYCDDSEFEYVLNLLETGCANLLDYLTEENKKNISKH